MAFREPIYDGQALPSARAHVSKLRGKAAKTATGDRGCKGRGQTGQRSLFRALLKVRAVRIKSGKSGAAIGIERALSPLSAISNPVTEPQAASSKEQLGDSLNFMLAASGLHCKKSMKKLKRGFFWFFFQLVRPLKFEGTKNIACNGIVKCEPIMAFEGSAIYLKAVRLKNSEKL